MYKFYDCRPNEGENSYSGYIAIENSKNKPESIEKVFKDNFGMNGAIFDWNIVHTHSKSYITMLPVEKIQFLEALLLNSAFVTMDFQNGNNSEKAITHKNSSLEIINNYENRSVYRFLERNPNITLDNHDIAVLKSTHPDSEIDERMDKVFSLDDLTGEVITNNKKVYEKIIARKKDKKNVIPFTILMSGMYSYITDSSFHYHKHIADINITGKTPRFNMKDNFDTVNKKLNGVQDIKHPLSFNRADMGLLHDYKFTFKECDTINQEYLISVLLDWPEQ